MAKPNILFVTYGGGHGKMILPVIRELQKSNTANCHVLALTGAGNLFKSENIPHMGFKDFITAKDEVALTHGKKLAQQHHNPETGMDIEETIAYLGLSYGDLIERMGMEKAEELYQQKSRHAFRPITILRRVFDRINPDLVVVTNSPRAEAAAVDVANERGIPSLALIDLFGICHFHIVQSTHIATLCAGVKQNMVNEGVSPDIIEHITGNPAFDRALEFSNTPDADWAQKHFPQIPANEPTTLWIDTPAYWNIKQHIFHIRPEQEVIDDLNNICVAAEKNNSWLLIRPHPSQPTFLFHDWIAQQTYAKISFAGGEDLYPLLQMADVVASYTSTVLVESVYMNKKILQLKYQPEFSDVPLAEWDLAWPATHPDNLAQSLHQALTNQEDWNRIQKNMEKRFPKQAASPKIASVIEDILEQQKSRAA